MDTIKCANCNTLIAPEQSGNPCPKCGGMNRNIIVSDRAIFLDYAKKEEFLNNLRMARNLFCHPRADADRRRAAVWLTPKSLRGFNAEDFPELGPSQRSELEAAVRDFLDVAKQVAPNETATSEQLASATSVFRRILAILEPYLTIPAEAKKVEKAIASVDFPGWIVNWDYKLKNNSDDEPAVWIDFFTDDQTMSRMDMVRSMNRVTPQIRDAIWAAGIDRWAYSGLTTAIEHKST